MIRALLAWLDRRIDARIEARRAADGERMAASLKALAEIRLAERRALDRTDAAQAGEART